MDYSKQELPPADSQTNASGQPYPQDQYAAEPQGQYPPGPADPYPKGPQGQYPAAPQPASYPPGAYGQPVQTNYGTVVATQPYGLTGPIGGPAPPDYMIPSILVCLFCFCPTGIFAIYYANRRTNMLAQGDIPEAQRSADCARNLMIASIVIGISWIIFVVILRVVLLSSYYSYSY